MRIVSCSRAISIENTATGVFAEIGRVLGMLSANVVLPIEGAATMIRSPGCMPAVIRSRSL